MTGQPRWPIAKRLAGWESFDENEPDSDEMLNHDDTP